VHRALDHQIRGEFQKTQRKAKSATNFKHKCVLVFLVHISLGINQQLACLCVTIHGSEMQFGVSSTRTAISKKPNATQNQSQISNTNAYLVVAFTSDLA
jgi:hypothetical protein